MNTLIAPFHYEPRIDDQHTVKVVQVHHGTKQEVDLFAMAPALKMEEAMASAEWLAGQLNHSLTNPYR